MPGVLINQFVLIVELQDKRDKYCNEILGPSNNCAGNLFARFDFSNRQPNTFKWRCYYEEALTMDRWRFDKTKSSPCYYTKDSEIKSFPSEGTLTHFAKQGHWFFTINFQYSPLEADVIQLQAVG